MKRVAFKMKLKTGFKEEYKKRHNEIWPSLATLLINSGISEYSIFFDEETHTLFAVQNQASGIDAAKLPEKEIVKEWWAYMEDLMETNPDHSPVVTPLEEVFYLP
jgi:L-rhamnose mutarotase